MVVADIEMADYREPRALDKVNAEAEAAILSHERLSDT